MSATTSAELRERVETLHEVITDRRVDKETRRVAVNRLASFLAWRRSDVA